MKRHSIFSRTGLPEAFGAGVLAVGLVLLVLSPWLGGMSVASYTLPALPAKAVLFLRIFGAPAFVVLCLFFFPILRDAKQPLLFVSISTHRSDKYWCEGENDHHHDKISHRATQYFRMTAWESNGEFWKEHSDPVNSDPVFDVTVKNDSDESLLVLKVGVLILEVAHANYLWGFPTAVRVSESEFFSIELPNLRERLKGLYDGFDLEAKRIGEVVSISLRDPFGLEAQAPFRYALHLTNFCQRMPNHVRLRIWCKTDRGEFQSGEIALLSY